MNAGKQTVVETGLTALSVWFVCRLPVAAVQPAASVSYPPASLVSVDPSPPRSEAVDGVGQELLVAVGRLAFLDQPARVRRQSRSSGGARRAPHQRRRNRSARAQLADVADGLT